MGGGDGDGKRGRQVVGVSALCITGEGREVVRVAPMVMSDHATCMVCLKLTREEGFRVSLETEKLIFLLGKGIFLFFFNVVLD